MEIALTLAKREAKIAKWFSDYSKQLLDYVGSKISDFADAEDLAQDVWAQVTKIPDVDEIDQISNWLYTTARNRITDFYRKKKSVALSSLITDADSEDLFFTEENLPADALENKEFWEILAAGLEQLPPEQRDVFVEHEINGISFNEISAKTGVPLNTLLARKRYATLKLRKIFEELNT
jgi:RNA polymerase sigma factor (sigma-70 family)